MSAELKPCPFCGEANPCRWIGANDKGDGTWRLYCESCGVGLDGGKSSEAIGAAWNTRAPIPPAEEIAAMRDLVDAVRRYTVPAMQTIQPGEKYETFAALLSRIDAARKGGATC